MSHAQLSSHTSISNKQQGQRTLLRPMKLNLGSGAIARATAGLGAAATTSGAGRQRFHHRPVGKLLAGEHGHHLAAGIHQHVRRYRLQPELAYELLAHIRHVNVRVHGHAARFGLRRTSALQVPVAADARADCI